MSIAEDFACRVAERTAQSARGLAGSPGGGSIDRQANEAAVVEGLVALGLAKDPRQGPASRGRIQPLSEVAQRIMAKRNTDPQGTTRRRTHQRFDRIEGRASQHLAHQQGPEQDPRGNLRLSPTVSRVVEIPPESKTPRQVVEQATWRRAAHLVFFLSLRRCCRASTSSCALAARTSRTASWNSRPARTRRRTSSAHSEGIRSTCRSPWTMKVRDQAGCPLPRAQRQVGFPQRV